MIFTIGWHHYDPRLKDHPILSPWQFVHNEPDHIRAACQRSIDKRKQVLSEAIDVTIAVALRAKDPRLLLQRFIELELEYARVETETQDEYRAAYGEVV